MAANLLSSPRAIDVSVYLVRAFVRMRELAATHGNLAMRLADVIIFSAFPPQQQVNPAIAMRIFLNNFFGIRIRFGIFTPREINQPKTR